MWARIPGDNTEESAVAKHVGNFRLNIKVTAFTSLKTHRFYLISAVQAKAPQVPAREAAALSPGVPARRRGTGTQGHRGWSRGVPAASDPSSSQHRAVIKSTQLHQTHRWRHAAGIKHTLVAQFVLHTEQNSAQESGLGLQSNSQPPALCWAPAPEPESGTALIREQHHNASLRAPKFNTEPTKFWPGFCPDRFC